MSNTRDDIKRTTKQLASICCALQDIAGSSSSNGLATEATLLSVLNNIIASQDVEILLVRDTGNSDQVVQQIREYDNGTGVWTTKYEDVNGAAYVPTGPIVYLDPSAVLNLVLTELVNLNTTDFATETTLASLASTNFATETTLNSVLTDTTTIVTPQINLTPGYLVVDTSGPGSITAGKRRATVLNSGTTDAQLLGETLKPGVSVTFSAEGFRDTLGTITYDALTSELTIATIG